MKVSLEGRRALVTGAARGIGQAIVSALSANGARVALADIDGMAVKKTAQSVPDSFALEMDISDESQVNQAVAEVVQHFGGIDILVNNAGVNTMKHRVNIDQFPLEE